MTVYAVTVYTTELTAWKSLCMWSYTFEHDMTCLDIFMDQTRIVLSIGVINIFHQTWQ